MSANPISIQPDAHVEERLFLLRLLEKLWDDCSTMEDWSDLAGCYTTIMGQRHVAARYCDYVKGKNLEPILALLYEDLLTYADGLANLVTQLQRTIKEAQTRAEQPGRTPSLGGGGLVGEILQSIWSSYSASQDAKEFMTEQITAVCRQFDQSISALIARKQNAALELAEKYCWPSGEAGFDLPADFGEQIGKFREAKDFVRLLPFLDAIHRRRPRDPFAAVEHHAAASQVPGVKPEDLQRLAEGCVAAACLVPPGAIYDTFRGQFLTTAADIAQRSAATAYDSGEKPWGPNPLAAYAVEVWKARDNYFPLDLDQSGELRFRRALTLAFNGQFAEAHKQAAQVWELQQKNSTYVYFIACLLNHVGRPDDALTILKFLIGHLGFHSIATARKDPNLSALRQDRASEFDDLTVIRCKVTIDWGFFNDDILFTNESLFPLTNVTMRASVQSAHSGTWYNTPDMTIGHIDPQKAARLAKVISINGNKLKSWRYFLQCDQGRWDQIGPDGGA